MVGHTKLSQRMDVEVNKFSVAICVSVTLVSTESFSGNHGVSIRASSQQRGLIRICVLIHLMFQMVVAVVGSVSHRE